MGNPNILKALPTHWERFYPTRSDGTVALRSDGVRIVLDEDADSRRPYRVLTADGMTTKRPHVRQTAGPCRAYTTITAAAQATDRDFPMQAMARPQKAS